MTGYAENVVDGSEFQGEGMEVILKPFSPGSLIDRIRKMLSHEASGWNIPDERTRDGASGQLDTDGMALQ